MRKTYWKGVMRPSALYVEQNLEVIGEDIDKLQKADNRAQRRILKAPKWVVQAAIRG